jgi:hypothetical protein
LTAASTFDGKVQGVVVQIRREVSSASRSGKRT